MGQETERVNTVLGMNGKQIMTKPAPGQYVIEYQDVNGKSSIWKSSLEDDLLTFNVSIKDVHIFVLFIVKLKLVLFHSLLKA